MIFPEKVSKLSLLLVIVLTASISSVFAQHTWLLQDTPTQENLNGVDFITDNTGIAVGDNGTILRTTDGGLNWEQIAISYTNNLNGLAFSDLNIIFVVGSGGLVLKSVDQGLTWNPLNIPGVTYNLNDISMNPVFSFGLITGQTNAIIQTNDRGETWTIIQDGYMSDFFAADVFMEAGGLVIGWNSIFQPLLAYSADGQSWDFCNFYPTWGGVMYEGVARGGKFMTSEFGFIVGTYFVPGGGFLAPFGGWSNNSWEAQSFPEPLRDIDYMDLYAITVGNNGYIAESFDGGATWSYLNLNLTLSDLNDVKLTGSSGYIVGNNGVILKKSPTISIEEPGKDEIRCFPNPCKDNLSIELPGKPDVFKAEIYNSSGKLVLEKTYLSSEGEISFDVENFESGFYIVRIATPNDLFTAHFVK